MSILDTIVAAAKRRVDERRRELPRAELERRLADAPPQRSLVDALDARPFSVVAEHKRRSPSSGAMDAGNIARCVDVYAARPWIAAVSVLTDVDHFDGSLDDLRSIRAKTEKPVLRKDFIVDEYQVVEARAAGADAILLMTALHVDDPPRMHALYELARETGLDVLVEVGETDRSAEELRRAAPEQARLWGINARAFRSGLGVSLDRHRELFSLLPPGKLAIAESGIHSAEDLRAARDIGYRAALIGTAFVKGPRSVEDVADALERAFEEANGEQAAAG